MTKRPAICWMLAAACVGAPGLAEAQVIIRPTNTVHWVSDQDPLNTLTVRVAAPRGQTTVT